MSFQFRPAVREGVSLIIVVAGGTGSGKTFSAMRLASGIAGEKRFAVIDTEAGRAKHYADQFKFDHGDLAPPFSPARYTEAIMAADAAHYPVIVVDSMTHEHAGDGGLLDMQEAELQRMAGDDWKRREVVKMASWIKPKGEHKRMMSKLLQVRAHLILCFRAEEKIEMVRNAEGKMEVRKKVTATGLDGWVPICEKNIPYEATCSFLLLATNPGVPLPIKLQEQHRAFFPKDKPITEDSGRHLSEWARGETKAAERVTSDRRESQADSPEGGDQSGSGAAPASAAPETQHETLKRLCDESKANLIDLLARAGVKHGDELSAKDFSEAKAMLERRKQKVSSRTTTSQPPEGK